MTKPAVSAQRYFLKSVITPDNQYQVILEHDTPLVAGKDSAVHFTVKHSDGDGLELDNYLGASMHLAGFSDDLKEYVHTHPSNHDAHGGAAPSVPADDGHDHEHSLLPAKIALAHTNEGGETVDSEVVMFNVNFPKPGIYKLIPQFRPKGITLPGDQSLFVEFWVQVEADYGQTVAKVEMPEPTVKKMSVGTQKTMLFIISIILMALLSRFVYKKIQV